MTRIELSALPEGKPVKVFVEDQPVCVVRSNNEVFAVSDICTHSYAELSDGETKGFTIECWLHGAEFDLRTGEAITLPATEALETFEVVHDGDGVLISKKN